MSVVPLSLLKVSVSLRERERVRESKSFINSCLYTLLPDISDGNMRAIYSLFYNLSHFKKMAKEGGHGEGGGGIPSRIARPISPGLKSTLSVTSAGSSGIPTSSKLASPSSSSSLTNGPAASTGTAAAAARRGAGERSIVL